MGVSPGRIGRVIGITKAYCTRVGSGPFPSELHNETGEALRKAGGEFGATTGRPRRCGWLDIPQLKYSIMINGVTELVMTKADVLSGFDDFSMAVKYAYDGNVTTELPYDLQHPGLACELESVRGWHEDISNCQDFDDLPEEVKNYVARVEELLEVPVTFVSVGPEREALLTRNAPITA